MYDIGSLVHSALAQTPEAERERMVKALAEPEVANALGLVHQMMGVYFATSATFMQAHELDTARIQMIGVQSILKALLDHSVAEREGVWEKQFSQTMEDLKPGATPTQDTPEPITLVIPGKN